MSQLQPDRRAAGVRARRRAHARGSCACPGWLALLLANPKSRFGLVIVLGFMVLVALIAPLDLGRRPDRRSSSSTRSRRRRGTTSSARPTRAATSSRRSCSGTRRSLILGAAAALLATVARDGARHPRRVLGGIVDEIVNFLTNVFLVIPTIPLLIVDLGAT